MDSQKTKTVEIVVNGGRREVPPGLMLNELLAFLEIDPLRVAVELDRRIVRQLDWAITPVAQGAAVEIVQFVGGG